MNKITLLAAALLLSTSASAQIYGRNQLSLIAEHVPASTVSEALFPLTISTFNVSGVTLGGASVSKYTITNGKSLNITGLLLGVEAGGSAPAVSRVDFSIRVSTSPLAGDCTVTSPLVYEAVASGAATAKAITTVVVNPDITIQGNGNTTICFTQLTPDWVNGTNVSSTTVSLSAFEL